MPVDGEKETIVQRRVEAQPSAAGSIASLLIVLGVIAAVALGWWVVGTEPAPNNGTTSQTPAAT